MSKESTPEKADGRTCPEPQNIVVSQSQSDLIAIANASGEFKKHYGRFWGGFIQLCFVNAITGRRPLLWGGVVSLGTVAGSLVLKYGMPIIPW